MKSESAENFKKIMSLEYDSLDKLIKGLKRHLLVFHNATIISSDNGKDKDIILELFAREILLRMPPKGTPLQDVPTMEELAKMSRLSVNTKYRKIWKERAEFIQRTCAEFIAAASLGHYGIEADSGEWAYLDAPEDGESEEHYEKRLDKVLRKNKKRIDRWAKEFVRELITKMYAPEFEASSWGV